MNNVANKFNLEMSYDELNEKIKQYYSRLDESVVDVSIKYYLWETQGQWSNAWQREIGSVTRVKFEVTLVLNVKAFGKNETTKKVFDLNEKQVGEILTDLGKEENIEVKYVTPLAFNPHKGISMIVEKKNIKENVKKDNMNNLLYNLSCIGKNIKKKTIITILNLLE